MSLLFHDSTKKINNVARKVFDKQFETDNRLNIEYDDRRKALMYEDIFYNLSFLDVAIEFEEEKIFTDYAVWIYQLLCHLMKDLDKLRIKDHMVSHYKILNQSLSEILPKEEAEKVCLHLNNAIRATEVEAMNIIKIEGFQDDNYIDIKKGYLELLIKNDTRGAVELIKNAEKSGIKLDDIYTNIIQDVMYEVGNLWHRNEITVDKEHYCTSTTQVALSQFYHLIFSKPRNGHKVITCCVGSELHEIGIRMLSDLFEFHGWESIYLGAAVPKKALLNSIEENKPDLVALSVTMPQHLSLCFEMANEIRAKYGDSIKIAVGGRAFRTTDKLWEKWDVDVSTDNAIDLIKWANNNITGGTHK